MNILAIFVQNVYTHMYYTEPTGYNMNYFGRGWMWPIYQECTVLPHLPISEVPEPDALPSPVWLYESTQSCIALMGV